jgi:hypothetical protein
MHGAADSPKRNSAAFPKKKLCVSHPYPLSPDPLSPPPKSVLLRPLIRPPLVVVNPLDVPCKCLGVRRGFRVGCAPEDCAGGGGVVELGG